MYRPDRRRLLGSIGTVCATVVAGCTDDPDPVIDGGDDSGDTGNNDEEQPGGAAPAELSIVDVAAPSWTATGESVTVELVVENTGGTNGTFRDTLIDRASDEALEPIEFEVPPGETTRWESQPIVRESVPSIGRLPLGGQTHDWSTTIDIVDRLSLGDRIRVDGLSVQIAAFVRTDSYEYNVGGRREVLDADDGQTFLFVYLTVDADSPAALGALPRRSSIGIEHDGAWIRAITPSFVPAQEPLAHGGSRRSRIDIADVADGLAMYDPDVIEATATAPPDERSLGDRDPIALGQSSWVLVQAPADVSIWDLSVLLSR